MKNIIAFGASTSSKSINQKLAHYAANQLGMESQIIKLLNYETPIYSSDREAAGFPLAIQQFTELIKSADGIIISFAEHNGHVSAAFKNVYDWVSRYDRTAWSGKKLFLMATSPGGHGGKSVLEAMTKTYGHARADVVAHFSLPSFYENFNTEITDDELKYAFTAQLDLFQNTIEADELITIPAAV